MSARMLYGFTGTSKRARPPTEGKVTNAHTDVHTYLHPSQLLRLGRLLPLFLDECLPLLGDTLQATDTLLLRPGTARHGKAHQIVRAR